MVVLMLAGIVYAGLRQIKADVLTFTVSLKCFNSIPIGFEYESKDAKEIKTPRQFLKASSGSMQMQFELEDFEDFKHPRIYLGDTVNTIYIEGFSISKRHLSKIEYLYYWNGIESIEKIIQGLNNCKIGDETSMYIQIETNNAPNYFEINMKPFEDKLIKYKSIYSIFKYVVFSIGFSLFIWLSYWVRSTSPKIMKNRWNRFRMDSITIQFIFILFIIFINSLYPFIPDLNNFENRNLYSKPTLSRDNIFQYPDLLTRYIQDHFAFRSYLVYINSFIHMKLFNVSTVPDLVVDGKQDWLYINANGSMMDYRRMTKIDTAMSAKIVLNFTQRMEWLNKMNCKFYIFSPPNKERIYPEYMPSRYTSNGVGYNSYEYYKNLFQKNSNIDFIDPVDSLLNGKKKRFVYYSNDTHWNQYGAFKGYQALMVEIKKSFPELTIIQENDLTINENSQRIGDLSILLGLPRAFNSKEYLVNLKDTSNKLNYNHSIDPLLSFRRNKTFYESHLKLLMFVDSYGYYLMPLLNMYFRESVYVRNQYFMADLIEKEKPDIVIFESLERLLSFTLLTPNPKKIKMKSD
jgi:alginate O-acetyltransferase complex protein AlgJ